jgi:wyosine [tRNA(Phe)-imidazoG37] synthetase (radical SAM superfamily)
MATRTQTLNVRNHDRDSAGLRYVYPVVSRRAGGVSIGVNLNPNNACNWACIYCQVPNLVRGGPPPLDLELLALELNRMLDDIQSGDFMETQVPPEERRLMDIAFSGNGEPTSAPEFAEAVALVVRIMRERGLADLKLRLITNGSLVQRRYVQEGLRLMAEANCEVWFKVDAVEPRQVLTTNGVHQRAGAALSRLRLCAGIAPTWVQTCMLAIDGQAPTESQVAAYLDFLAEARGCIRGVLLYGLARPSMQPGAERLNALPAAWMESMGERIAALGLAVQVSP